MAREAKHALIFLGILLLVFVGLLWKHWHSPGAALHLFADSAAQAHRFVVQRPHPAARAANRRYAAQRRRSTAGIGRNR